MKADTSKIADALKKAIFETFEKLFYVFLEAVDNGAPPYAVETAIRFDGVCSGQMKLFFSRDLAETMVANLLNRDRGKITEQDIEDCTKEAVNVVCGSFLGKIEGRIGIDLSIPVYREFVPGAVEASEMDFVYRGDFDAEGARLGVWIALRGSVS
jgi:chemotaxis protein CheY-P-specific phosphatase CheC